MDLFLQASEEAVRRSCNGETVALNASPYFETPAMALLFPYSGNGRNQTCIITFSIETISDILGTDSINQTFIINDSDELLCHPETKRVLRGESLKNDALVMEMRRNNQNNDDSRQILYEVTDSSGKKSRYYGAYKKLAFGDIVILTTVPFDTILEGVITTRKNNIYLTCIVFFFVDEDGTTRQCSSCFLPDSVFHGICAGLQKLQTKLKTEILKHLSSACLIQNAGMKLEF